MSQENVEIVRRHLEDWRRDDFDAFVSKVHSDIEWHAVLQRLVEGPESVYRGREGIRRLWHTYRTELDGFEVEADEIRDVGDDRVVLLGRIRWRGAASGIETESPFAVIEHELHLGAPRGLPARRPAEDDVLHRLAADRRR